MGYPFTFSRQYGVTRLSIMTYVTFTVIRFINSLSPGVSYTYHTVCGCDFTNVEFEQNLWIDILSIGMNFSRNRCQRISLMVGQHWFMYWLDAVRQLAITRTTVDQICVAIWPPKTPVGWHDAAYNRSKMFKKISHHRTAPPHNISLSQLIG